MDRWFAIAALCFLVPLSTATCVVRGVCPAEDDDAKNPCVVDAPPQVPETERARQVLADLCGDLFPDASVCCSDEQLLELAEQMESARSLGVDDCPACGSNFRNLICSMLCSPEQQRFLRVVRTGPSRKTGCLYVAELDYHVSADFASGLYNACSEARSRIPSIKLLHFMCGKWGEECSEERWLDFLGATPEGGGLSPMRVNYVRTGDSRVVVNGTVYRPMDLKAYPCNARDDPSKTCECRHCPAACNEAPGAP